MTSLKEQSAEEFTLTEHDKLKEPEHDAGPPQDFDDVLELVGSVGKYQRFLLYAILFPITILESMFTANVWFMMDEPPHWCHVPGRESSGLTMEQWKNLTIPLTSNGQFDKCLMYNVSSFSDDAYPQDPSTIPVISCTSGWDYDMSVADFRSTLMEESWVCDKGHYPTMVHTGRYIGRAVGTILFGLLADKIGRKPVFIIITVLFSVGRAISFYTVSNIYVFVVLSSLIGFGSPMFAITINLIAIELSGKEYRAWIYSATWMIFTVGDCLVPGISYISQHWLTMGWTTILLGSICYLLLPFIPESPRWLLTQRRVPEVVEILQKIARWNGNAHKFQDNELTTILEGLTQKEAESDSVVKLFSSARMAMFTLLITFTWVMNGLVGSSVSFNSFYISGNRYLNYIMVGSMELPGGLVGGVLCNKMGRRWTQTLFFAIAGISSVVGGYFSVYAGGIEDASGWATLGQGLASNVTKFAITVSFLVIYLQATEIFPTTLRTTGSGFASTTSSVTKTVIPYIVYVGKSSQMAPWIFCVVSACAGMVSSMFIPETKNKKLPTTLKEAEQFGKGEKFCSFRLTKT